MSSLHDVIRQRRSVRKYFNKEIPAELILEVLKAAQWAPSAHNSQCWRFITIQDEKIKHVLAKKMADAWKADLEKDGEAIVEEKYKERIDRFASAPALILVCLTMDGLRKFPDSKRQSWERDLAVESASASIQNMLLTAHAMGLGACWFCAPAFAKDTVRKVLRIPDSVEPLAMIILGYPDEKTKVPPRKHLKEFCYANVWGKQLI